MFRAVPPAEAAAGSLSPSADLEVSAWLHNQRGSKSPHALLSPLAEGWDSLNESRGEMLSHNA